MTDFYVSIKEHREAAGLTQTRLSEISGVDRANISAHELRKRFLGIVSLSKVADALGFELTINLVKKEHNNAD